MQKRIASKSWMEFLKKQMYIFVLNEMATFLHKQAS